MFSELIDKYGPSDWLDPLMDSLGPYIQLQLGGMSVARSDSLPNTYYYVEPQPISENKAFIGLMVFSFNGAVLTTSIEDFANFLEFFSK